MCIAGRYLSAVVNNNVVTVAAVVFRRNNGTVISGLYLIARNISGAGSYYIYSLMEVLLTENNTLAVR